MRTAFSVVFAAVLATQGAFADAQAPAGAASAGAAPAAAAAPAAPAAAAPAAAAPAPAAAAAPAKPDSAAGGKIAAGVCAACHGADGNSTIVTNPKLAGQHPEYLAKQLAAFKENKDRSNAVMLGFAAALSPDDMRNVAAYFSEQAPKEGAAHNAATVKLGEKIYRGGIAEKSVPACAACHGPAGSGIPAQYPRLAGQWFDYTQAQLAAFRLGQRKNDPASAMRDIAGRLSDQEMAAVADYIAGLKSAN
jgi:cytochrome c553